MSKKLSSVKYLFWDVDIKSLTETHEGFVIERILEKGRMEDIVWLFSNFAKDTIKNVIKSSQNLSSKTVQFWNLILQ